IDLISAHAGVGEQVADITERAMAGLIDFTGSLTERVALLSGLPESVLDEVRSQITLTEGAAELVAAVHDSGGQVALVSVGFTAIIARVAAQRGTGAVRANALADDKRLLTGRTSGRTIAPSAAAETFAALVAAGGYAPEATVAVGDGAIDFGMIRAGGLGI